MDDIRVKHEDYFDFVAVSGGMVVGDNIQPIATMKEFLKDAIPRVEEYSGVVFGEKYKSLVEEGTYMNNSIKPAIALGAFKSMQSLRSVEFAHDIQFEHFYNGRDLNEKEVYIELAKNYDVNPDELLTRMNHEQSHKMANDDFEFVKKLGINGFPCVLGQTTKGIYRLTQGYIHEQQMEEIMQAFRKTIEEGEQEVDINQ